MCLRDPTVMEHILWGSFLSHFFLQLGTFLFVCFVIYSFGRESNRELGERDFPFISLLLKWPPWPGLGLIEARSSDSVLFSSPTCVANTQALESLSVVPRVTQQQQKTLTRTEEWLHLWVPSPFMEQVGWTSNQQKTFWMCVFFPCFLGDTSWHHKDTWRQRRGRRGKYPPYFPS